MTFFKKYKGLAGWIAVSFLAGVAGGFFMPGPWYQTIQKPSFTPPDWVFPVVWPVLYICMGTAAWLIWKEHGFTETRRTLKWFILQLVLNAIWPMLFFGLHAVGTALGEILLLWIAILFTLLLFWQKNKTAGRLMLPYLLWTSYAVLLNFAILNLN